jgi:hypothetical protein
VILVICWEAEAETWIEVGGEAVVPCLSVVQVISTRPSSRSAAGNSPGVSSSAVILDARTPGAKAMKDGIPALEPALVLTLAPIQVRQRPNPRSDQAFRLLNAKGSVSGLARFAARERSRE